MYFTLGNEKFNWIWTDTYMRKFSRWKHASLDISEFYYLSTLWQKPMSFQTSELWNKKHNLEHEDWQKHSQLGIIKFQEPFSPSAWSRLGNRIGIIK